MLASSSNQSSRSTLSKKVQRILQLLVKADWKLQEQLQVLKQSTARNHHDTYASLIGEIEDILEKIKPWKLSNTWDNINLFSECCTSAKVRATSINATANSHGIMTNLLLAISKTINNIDLCMQAHVLEMSEQRSVTESQRKDVVEETGMSRLKLKPGSGS